ncbi:GPI ethanolamine phosphate transferase [Actinidia chinensis var. chinensis]|uniref:GPI ethanolamine phosphate transferase n=1 Tax=Actinidia chinensis var. chinensis TaxID=1590841 RepID=A0A2R6PVL0_ACTCC|nr:GPI ethanolamine phosphate transferase [Actinidia chinensis var. chinensis]
MDALLAWRRRTEEKGRIWPFLSIFFLILVLHLVAILLFARGFLLTKTELPYYSKCSDISQSPCFQPPHSLPLSDKRDTPHRHPNINNERCWTKPAIDRLVIIVLDALRFDFVAPSCLFEDKKPWMDKLQVLHKLASREGSSARIFKAIADPPTTTLQRLKGLTTGGLPTFIDVGNSFGAPAILEDNLISQLAQNGKRVVMMGDDTWLQLFPHHFNECYPFPSFNVKDLHTVDNGCTKHLFPSLYEGDWDVLIAHFLGVDHAGHIFGVNSIPMVEKLEQYNIILEAIVDGLESQSGPGGLHENTLLLVMGDHGQTINGDHGGGNAEEVETAIFAMGLKKPPSALMLECDTSSCPLDSDGGIVCISSIQQLDFAATVSALLGVPFPFGSIGCVNSELYALAAGTWNSEGSVRGICQNNSSTGAWMQNYVNVLCINSWQVKRYIDVYSTSSVIGFSNEDLLHLSALYAQAAEMNLMLYKNESCLTSLPDLRMQIDAYFSFLESVAELARSKWTQFNEKTMGIGFGMMLISLLVHLLAIRRLGKLCGVYIVSHARSGISFGLTFSCLIVAIRACSFLSNSYILEEGKVTIFLAATTGMLNLRYSIIKKKMLLEVGIIRWLSFIFVNTFTGGWVCSLDLDSQIFY